MKRKVLFITLLLSVFLSGIAVASAVNQWHGFPITQLLSDGKPLVVADAPPIIIDGRAYVPLYMLRQAGMEVTWDPDTASVDAKIPVPLTDAQIALLSKSIGLVYAYDANGKAYAQGSGFMIEKNGEGIFITNDHVAGKAVSLTIILDGVTYTTHGESLFDNQVNDVFGVKIDAPQALPYLKTVPKVGTHVVAIGYPHGKVQVSRGWMDSIHVLNGEEMLGFSAETDFGSSGGPLLNEQGEVVGITTRLYNAIPTTYIQQEIDRIK